MRTRFFEIPQCKGVCTIDDAQSNLSRQRLSLGANSSPRSRLIGRAICLISISIFACQGCDYKTGATDDTPHKFDGGILRRGIGGEPASLDPGAAVDTFSFEVIRDLYEGLTTEAADGAVVPGVASSWTVNASGTQYAFHLRPDALWSNGKRIRAQDFVESWRRVVDPKRASPVADILRPIVGASAIIQGRLPPSSLGATAAQDDLLVVNLERPTPYFPQLLTHSATFPVYSDESAKSHNPINWVSNGPYVLSNWTPGSTISLRRNVSYWDRANVRIPNVEYIPIPDENAEYRQYRAGQLDITESVPSSALNIVRAERPNELFVAPFPCNGLLRAESPLTVLRVKCEFAKIAGNGDRQKSP